MSAAVADAKDTQPIADEFSGEQKSARKQRDVYFHLCLDAIQKLLTRIKPSTTPTAKVAHTAAAAAAQANGKSINRQDEWVVIMMEILHSLNLYLADDPNGVISFAQPHIDSMSSLTESKCELQRSLQSVVYENNLRRHPSERIGLFMELPKWESEGGTTVSESVSVRRSPAIVLAEQLSKCEPTKLRRNETSTDPWHQLIHNRLEALRKVYSTHMYNQLSAVHNGMTGLGTAAATAQHHLKIEVTAPYASESEPFALPPSSIRAERANNGSHYTIRGYVVQLINSFRSDLTTLVELSTPQEKMDEEKRFARFSIHVVHLLCAEPCYWSDDSIPMVAALTAYSLAGAVKGQPISEIECQEYGRWLHACATQKPLELVEFVRRLLADPYTDADHCQHLEDSYAFLGDNEEHDSKKVTAPAAVSDNKSSLITKSDFVHRVALLYTIPMYCVSKDPFLHSFEEFELNPGRRSPLQFLQQIIKTYARKYASLKNIPMTQLKHGLIRQSIGTEPSVFKYLVSHMRNSFAIQSYALTLF